MTSRVGVSYRMPPDPTSTGHWANPPNSTGVPPACQIPAFTASVTALRWMCPGLVSLQVLWTPMRGRRRSSASYPMALIRARTRFIPGRFSTSAIDGVDMASPEYRVGEWEAGRVGDSRLHPITPAPAHPSALRQPFRPLMTTAWTTQRCSVRKMSRMGRMLITAAAVRRLYSMK